MFFSLQLCETGTFEFDGDHFLFFEDPSLSNGLFSNPNSTDPRGGDISTDPRGHDISTDPRGRDISTDPRERDISTSSGFRDPERKCTLNVRQLV